MSFFVWLKLIPENNQVMGMAEGQCPGCVETLPFQGCLFLASNKSSHSCLWYIVLKIVEWPMEL